jgi:hypothetical protein
VALTLTILLEPQRCMPRLTVQATTLGGERVARDFESEMASFIEAHWPKGDFVPSIVATEWVEELLRDDPDLLTGYLLARAPSILADVIGKINTARRQQARRQAHPVSVFAEAAEKFESDGNPEPLAELTRSVFDQTFRIDVENTQRRLGDMTKDDHFFVAQEYEATGRAALLEREFHIALGKKVGNRRTQDVIDEVEYLRLRQSIVGRTTKAA